MDPTLPHRFARPRRALAPRTHSRLGTLATLAALATPLVFPPATAAIPAAPTAPAFFRSDLGRAAPHPGTLPDRLDDPAALRWRAPLDPGHSTPIVVGDRILLTTFQPATRELATVALDATTGKPLWRRAVVPGAIEQTHSIGSPATASPASDGERVFAFFGSYGLVAHDLEGRPAWEQRLGPFQDEYGAGSSPIVVGDRVILLQDHDTDSFLAAYDTATGRQVWRVARPDAVRSYSTPVLWEHQGHPELLVAGALELAGYDPADGRRLWGVTGLARIVIPTPNPAGDRVFIASWTPGGDASRRITLPSWKDALEKWDRNHDDQLARDEIDDPEILDRYFRMDLDRSGRLNEPEWNRHAEVFRRARNALLAIRPPAAATPGTGPATRSAGDDAILWSHARGVPYVASSVHDRDAVWMVKDGGIVTRLDADSGRVVYEERLPGPGNYYASPVVGDGRVYFVSQAGVVSVIDAAPAWKVVGSHDLHEKVFATPVFHGAQLLIRTEAALYCYARP